MARQPNIRIMKRDEKEYNKLRRKVKNKLRRTRKKYGIDLSNEIPTPNLNDFTTRQEFNRWKEQAQSFTNRFNLNYQFRKNKYGVVASKARLQKIKRDTKRAQEIASNIGKQVKDKPFIVGGKKKSTVGKQQLMLGRENYGGIYYPGDFNFEDFKYQDSLDAREKSIRKKARVPELEDKMQRMKDNYAEKVKEVFNSDGNEIGRKIDSMSAKDFYEMYLMYDEIDFFYLYESNASDYLSRIQNYIDRYERGDVSLDLSIF